MCVQSATYGHEPGTGVSRHVEAGDQRKWLRVRALGLVAESPELFRLKAYMPRFFVFEALVARP
jgi:hypothetical protein